MRNIYIIGLLISLFLTIACEKEDALSPSGYGRDWKIIEEPTTDDPVDWVRYEIYKNYGISTYYNDTLGFEKRTDMSGNDYIFYETLKVYYMPGSSKPDGIYDLLEDHSVLEPILTYFSKHVFPRFGNADLLPSFLFVDKIWRDKWRDSELNDYFGYNTMVFKAVNGFASLPAEEQQVYANSFISAYFGNMLASSTHAAWRDKFLGISKALNPNKSDLYSTELNYGTLLNAYQAFKGTNFTEKEQLGFIASVKNSRGQDITPTIALDLGSYVEAVLTCTQAEFEAMYGKYDGVMKKFKMMRKQLKALKFVLED